MSTEPDPIDPYYAPELDQLAARDLPTSSTNNRQEATR